MKVIFEGVPKEIADFLTLAMPENRLVDHCLLRKVKKNLMNTNHKLKLVLIFLGLMRHKKRQIY